MKFPYIVIALTCMISAGIIMSATGIGAQVGGTPNPGLSEEDTVGQEQVDKVNSTQQGSDSVLGMAQSAGDWMLSMIKLVVLAPAALQNLGFSPAVAGALALPIWAITGFFIISVLRGIGVL